MSLKPQGIPSSSNPKDTLLVNPKISIRDQWARQHAIRAVEEEWGNIAPSLPTDGPQPHPLRRGDDGLTITHPPWGENRPPFRYPPPMPVVIHLGIVGAGIAGLFAAGVLDNLNKELIRRAYIPGVKSENIDEFYRTYDPRKNPQKLLHFTYEILESADQDRVGGRLFTYDFGGPRESHDYYDVGAMRFPDIPIMTRVFDLFNKLGMRKTDLKTDPDTQDGSIIPYYMKNADPESRTTEPWRYNDITQWGTYSTIVSTSSDSDPFKMATDGTIPEEIRKHSPDDVMKAAIEPFREALRDDEQGDKSRKHIPGDVGKAAMESFEKILRKGEKSGRAGWDLLMQYDTLSTRQFLGMDPPERLPVTDIPPPPYNYETIEWMETFNGGTNWYDQAFSETVLESMDFEYYDNKDVDWYCILGGAQQLAKILEKKIRHKPIYNNKVTKITATAAMKVDVDVDTTAGKDKKTYRGLFNTTTLGCMRRMDLRDAKLNYATKQALRSLGYGPASKVAIKFKRAWWIHDLGKYNIKMGGLGHSDLNGRICVYPSYNIYDDESKTAVLLCSYTWQQDAERIGALMSTNANHSHKVVDEVELKELLIRELVYLHKNDDMSDEDLYNLINNNYVDHHAFSWDNDPHAAGAFAFFRPQQFTHMWNRMIQPSGDVVICGEAASPHHAWVVGALESVVHGLHAWLAENVYAYPVFHEAMDILENRQEEKSNPFIGLPPYMEPNISKWHGFFGNLHRWNTLHMDQGRELRELFSELGLEEKGA